MKLKQFYLHITKRKIFKFLMKLFIQPWYFIVIKPPIEYFQSTTLINIDQLNWEGRDIFSPQVICKYISLSIFEIFESNFWKKRQMTTDVSKRDVIWRKCESNGIFHFDFCAQHSKLSLTWEVFILHLSTFIFNVKLIIVRLTLEYYTGYCTSATWVHHLTAISYYVFRIKLIQEKDERMGSDLSGWISCVSSQRSHSIRWVEKSNNRIST